MSWRLCTAKNEHVNLWQTTLSCWHFQQLTPSSRAFFHWADAVWIHYFEQHHTFLPLYECRFLDFVFKLTKEVLETQMLQSEESREKSLIRRPTTPPKSDLVMQQLHMCYADKKSTKSTHTCIRISRVCHKFFSCIPAARIWIARRRPRLAERSLPMNIISVTQFWHGHFWYLKTTLEEKKKKKTS